MQAKYSAMVQQAAEGVLKAFGTIPEVAVVLGSGLGVLTEEMHDCESLPFDQIPGFPPSTVDGHAGRLVKGKLGEVNLLAFSGRVHGYEGYSQNEVVLPVRLVAALGCESLLLTNAVGCINRLYHPGDLVLLEDQINLMFRNPLRGANDQAPGPRFPDMSAVTDPQLNTLIRHSARSEQIALRVGVMGGVTGPSYETPAEIRMLARMRADVVGMSTIPELIAARQTGLACAAISCVTNYAAGISKQPLNHAEVTETANRVREKFVRLVKASLQAFVANSESMSW